MINIENMKFTNIEIITIVIAFLAVLIPAIALWVTISQYKKQLQLNFKQLQLSFFSEYTKRYQEIMLNFPTSINRSDFDFDNLDLDVKERILVYMRAYFDLCSEEYFLNIKGNIDKKTWKEWESGIKYTFSKKAFKEGWILISLDSSYYEEFTKYVKGILI